MPVLWLQIPEESKGFWASRVVYHPGSTGKRGFNGWAVQIYRFLTTGKTRCIKCGEKLFR